VTYAGQAPVITNQREQLEIIYGRRSAPDEEDWQAKLLVKGRHQQGELEWRCFEDAASEQTANDDKDPDLWYDHRRFPVHELRGIYCGVALPEPSREPLIRLLRSRYPNVRLYQAKIVPGRYELEFDLINRN
jgi:hypothetical protein